LWKARSGIARVSLGDAPTLLNAWRIKAANDVWGKAETSCVFTIATHIPADL
jgi:hypothetical protein